MNLTEAQAVRDRVNEWSERNSTGWNAAIRPRDARTQAVLRDYVVHVTDADGKLHAALHPDYHPDFHPQYSVELDRPRGV